MDRAVAAVLRALLRVYQVTLSPLLGSACRFSPTCSHYAREALELHGATRGTWLAVRRVARCHPYAEGGYDPVPSPPSDEASQGRHRDALQHALLAAKESDA